MRRPDGRQGRDTGTRQALIEAAEYFFLQENKTPGVREIAGRAGVAIGMLTHHFHGYAGLVAALTERLNLRQAVALQKFEPPKRGSQLAIAITFFTAVARFDLDPRNARLRRVAGRFSWDWSASEESALAASSLRLLDPLRRHLKFENNSNPEDLLRALWAIYLEPLRLAAIDALLPPTKEKSADNLVSAIITEITPKFALILKVD